MRANTQAGRSPRGGFTAAEVLLAVMLFGVVTACVMPFIVWVMRFSRGGSQQAEFTMLARQSETIITRRIEAGRAAEASSNGVDIMYAGSATVARLEFVDLDANPLTLSNNVIRFDPNTEITGNEQNVCGYVGAMPGEVMFTNLDLSPRAIRFRYYVGEGTNANYAGTYSSSPGYQGLEVRFSAAPRNVGNFYNE